MRTKARTDKNHTEVSAGLRKLGLSVESIHTLGKGRPDILVGCYGRNFLFEIKTTPEGRLTETEQGWFNQWQGQKAIVWDVESALQRIYESFVGEDTVTCSQIYDIILRYRKGLE